MASSYSFTIRQEYSDNRVELLCSSIPHNLFNIELAVQYVSPLNLEESISETFHSSIICRRDTFLSQEYGPQMVSLMFANTVDASPEFIQTAIDDILSFAWEMNAVPFNLGRKTITLLVEVTVQFQTTDYYDYNISSLNLKPASRSFIQSLKRMKLGEHKAFLPLKKRGRLEGFSSKKQQCSICLDQLLEGDEVASLPCRHVFHHDCIVKWLETSHLCPLCRHRMPI